MKQSDSSRYLLIISFVFIAFTAATSLNAILPFLLIEQEASTSAIKMYGPLAAAFPLGQFCSAYLVAYLARKIDYRNIIQVTTAANVLANLSCGIALLNHQFVIATICRFISGSCEANVVLMRELIVVNTSTETVRNRLLGFVSTAITLGFIVGPLANAYLYNWNYFIGLFFPCLMALILFCLAFFMPAMQTSVPLTKDQPIQVNTVKQTAAIWLCCLTIFLGIDIFYQYIPLFLALRFSVDVQTTGKLLFLVAAANACSAAFSYYPSRIFSYKWILTAASSVFVINMFFLSHTTFLVLPFLLLCQGAIIAMISNNLIFFFTTKKLDNARRSAMGYLMSHVVATRALVSGISALTAGIIAVNGIALPFYISISCVLLFLGSIQWATKW